MMRFRVPRKLRARLERIAMVKCKTVTEVSREAVHTYVETEEKKLEPKSVAA